VSDERGGVDAFEAARRRLLGLAYRMLGTIGDAEDVVQETWLRWNAADRDAIDTPEAWLTTVTTRLALDRLKSAQRRREREQYPGPWLPEPVVTDTGPEEAAELADSLTLGFLTLLDRLGPVERAVFLLADVFGMPYAEVADAVGKTEVACRQIASRSRRRLQGTHSRRPTADERRIVDELLVAMYLGDVAAVLERLAPDAVCISDGGPQRRAARRPVVGANRVAPFCIKVTRKASDRARFVAAAINGDPGVIVYVGDGIDSVLAFEVDASGGRVAAIWIVRAPEKLDRVLAPVAMQ
jgi:RNA polymerase sigma-70 factor (ECF subfamily)